MRVVNQILSHYMLSYYICFTASRYYVAGRADARESEVYRDGLVHEVLAKIDRLSGGRDRNIDI